MHKFLYLLSVRIREQSNRLFSTYAITIRKTGCVGSSAWLAAVQRGWFDLLLQDGTNEQQDITDEFTEVSFEQRQAIDSQQTADQRRMTLMSRCCRSGVDNVDTVCRWRWTFAFQKCSLLIGLCNLPILHSGLHVSVIPGHVNNIHSNSIKTA